MKLLLDTCTFLWVVSGDEKLSDTARELILTPENECYMSPISAWEIAVKNALGRLPMPAPPDRFVPQQRDAHGIDTLPLDEMTSSIRAMTKED